MKLVGTTSVKFQKRRMKKQLMERKRENREAKLHLEATKFVKPQYLEEGEKNLTKLILEDTSPLVVKKELDKLMV